ncbi:MAG: dihydroneopterin aldolase [Bacteroidales bacterium]|nr:dihydroneopterin aldolase [Bacteroidales bacterium]
MSLISIENMKFYAYHGCFSEEQVIGTKFSADIAMECDTSLAEHSDNVNDTVDYSKVYLVVKQEVAKPSHLLEHVARRIINAVKEQFPMVSKVRLTLRKLNPPVGGHMDSVSVTIED